MQKQFQESSELQQRNRTPWSSKYKHGHKEVWEALYLHLHPQFRPAQCKEGVLQVHFTPWEKKSRRASEKSHHCQGHLQPLLPRPAQPLPHRPQLMESRESPVQCLLHCCASSWQLGPVAAVRPALRAPTDAVPTLWALASGILSRSFDPPPLGCAAVAAALWPTL